MASLRSRGNSESDFDGFSSPSFLHSSKTLGSHRSSKKFPPNGDSRDHDLLGQHSNDIDFDLDLSASPSAFKLAVAENRDSGISSATPPSILATRSRSRCGGQPRSPARRRESPKMHLAFQDSDDEDMNHNFKSPGTCIAARLDLTPPNEMSSEERMLSTPSTPFTPPSKKFRSLCLYDTPHTPKSLLQKAQKRIARISGERRRLNSTGNKSILDPDGPQANVNPFTPESPTYSGGRCKSNSKGLKRIRQADDSFTELMNDEELPLNKKIALREINTLRYHEEFHEVAKLGDGEFGSVYKCIHRLDGCPYAIKKSKMPVAGSAYERSAMNEVYAHAVLGKHQHVVRYYSAWAENDHMYIQNEFCNGSSLFDALGERRERDDMMCEAELICLMFQIAHGLKYIHSQHLVHLDIKPANIFMHKNDTSGESGIEEDLMEESEAEHLTYKIGDLGHVTSTASPQVEEGDVRYLPNEILQENFDFLVKADIFSLALTVYQMGSKTDLPKNGPAWHAIRRGDLPPLKHCSTEFNKLLSLMVSPDPASRPTASDVLHHPVICPMANVSKAQLKKQLNEQKWKNELLERELEELRQKQQGGSDSGSTMAPPSSKPAAGSSTRGTRIIGNGKKVNRSVSVTCF